MNSDSLGLFSRGVLQHSELGVTMDFDFSPIFNKYEVLVKAVEAVFARVKSDFPGCVKCKTGCSDCCHALFDLTLIEALYINHRFNQGIDEAKKAEIIEKANRADRKIYKIKRNAYKAASAGTQEEEILNAVAKERVRCPLLNSQDTCDLYEHRPITCRLYGVPTAIKGKSHTCGLSGFNEGKAYPTANMDALHRKLYELSVELIGAIRSKHIKMADMLVPLSMALLTDFDETYLGALEAKPSDREEEESP